jgi:hypothetical protein
MFHQEIHPAIEISLVIVLLSVTVSTKAGTKKARWKTLKSTHTQPREALFASWFELCDPNSA